MPTPIVDVDEFTDVTRPASADPRTASVWGEGHQALANRTRWLRNKVVSILPQSGPWLGQLIYPAPISTSMQFLLDRSVPRTPSDWVVEYNGAFDTMGIPQVDGAERLYLMPLPAGAVVTAVRVGVQCTTARAGANRWRGDLYRRDRTTVVGYPTWAPLTTIGATVDDGGAGASNESAWLAWTGLSQTMTSDSHLIARVRGPTGSRDVNDGLLSAVVSFDAVGPRSW